MDDELEEKRSKGKFWIRALIVGACLIVIFALVRVFGVFQWYTVEGVGNMPALKDGDQILATNLSTPERFDLVTFKYDYNGFEEVWIKRICAFEGEIVSFEDGAFFVDGQNMDIGLDLQYRYRCESAYAEIIARDLELVYFVDYYPTVRPDYYKDSMDLFLTHKQAKRKPLLERRILNVANDSIEAYWGEKWNTDYFGPVTVPKGYCFLLGDNRSNCLDSRYIGFIKTEDIYGVLF
ncbi:MAG: signal peptidase I [Crocinitomix sp.]|jgi:signal peptidase I